MSMNTTTGRFGSSYITIKQIDDILIRWYDPIHISIMYNYLVDTIITLYYYHADNNTYNTYTYDINELFQDWVDYDAIINILDNIYSQLELV